MVFTVVEAAKDMTGLAALAAELQATVNSGYGHFALRQTSSVKSSLSSQVSTHGGGGAGSVGLIYCLNTLRREAAVNIYRNSISLAGQNIARDSFSSLSPSLWWIGYMLVLL